LSHDRTDGPGFDFEAMRRAIEESDYDALLALYADNAELRTVNKNSTPSSPQMLQGKEEISEMLRDVCGRAMTHHVGRGHRRGAHSVQRGVRISRRD
jgi:ketosteroid isomerase-like protein